MPEASTLVLFALASLVLLVVPGPSVLYIVTRSLEQGPRAGIVSMLGVETGALVHVAAAAVGLSALLTSSAAAFTVVKYAGAAYLVYLGVRKLLRGGAQSIARQRPRHSRLFWDGMIVNVLNPKTGAFFLAFLPQFVDPGRGGAPLQVLLLGATFVLLAVLSDGAYALLAGTAARWLHGGARSRRWLDRMTAGVYIGLGAAAALSGARPARAP